MQLDVAHRLVDVPSSYSLIPTSLSMLGQQTRARHGVVTRPVSSSSRATEGVSIARPSLGS
ncbi:MAG: hypothetical protein AAGF11_39995 [Myxococcota bacterium]